MGQSRRQFPDASQKERNTKVHAQQMLGVVFWPLS
jgi:hypothetical protein